MSVPTPEMARGRGPFRGHHHLQDGVDLLDLLPELDDPTRQHPQRELVDRHQIPLRARSIGRRTLQQAIDVEAFELGSDALGSGRYQTPASG